MACMSHIILASGETGHLSAITCEDNLFKTYESVKKAGVHQYRYCYITHSLTLSDKETDCKILEKEG